LTFAKAPETKRHNLQEKKQRAEKKKYRKNSGILRKVGPTGAPTGGIDAVLQGGTTKDKGKRGLGIYEKAPETEKGLRRRKKRGKKIQPVLRGKTEKVWRREDKNPRRSRTQTEKGSNNRGSNGNVVSKI